MVGLLILGERGRNRVNGAGVFDEDEVAKTFGRLVSDFYCEIQSLRWGKHRGGNWPLQYLELTGMEKLTAQNRWNLEEKVMGKVVKKRC